MRDGREITVFEDVEEMKWFYHARLCKDSSDMPAQFMTSDTFTASVKAANEMLKTLWEPCEVKEAE